jgi:hypothetical protein
LSIATALPGSSGLMLENPGSPPRFIQHNHRQCRHHLYSKQQLASASSTPPFFCACDRHGGLLCWSPLSDPGQCDCL